MTPRQKFELINRYRDMGFKVFYCPLVGEGVFYEIIECREYHLLGHAIKVQLPNIGPAHYRLERVSDNELKYLERVSK